MWYRLVGDVDNTCTWMGMACEPDHVMEKFQRVGERERERKKRKAWGIRKHFVGNKIQFERVRWYRCWNWNSIDLRYKMNTFTRLLMRHVCRMGGYCVKSVHGQLVSFYIVAKTDGDCGRQANTDKMLLCRVQSLCHINNSLYMCIIVLFILHYICLRWHLTATWNYISALRTWHRQTMSPYLAASSCSLSKMIEALKWDINIAICWRCEHECGVADVPVRRTSSPGWMAAGLFVSGFCGVCGLCVL